jgi:hypothetical protein
VVFAVRSLRANARHQITELDAPGLFGPLPVAVRDLEGKGDLHMAVDVVVRLQCQAHRVPIVRVHAGLEIETHRSLQRDRTQEKTGENKIEGEYRLRYV